MRIYRDQLYLFVFILAQKKGKYILFSFSFFFFLLTNFLILFFFIKLYRFLVTYKSIMNSLELFFNRLYQYDMMKRDNKRTGDKQVIESPILDMSFIFTDAP